mgnify:CR=1 FL=1
MIRARVNIQTKNKSYKPGEIIKEFLSEMDREFLKKHHFITIETEEDSLDIQESEIEEDFSDITYKDESELKKLNKDEIVEYAAGIGLELDIDILKNDMIDAVLNYIEEKMEE